MSDVKCWKNRFLFAATLHFAASHSSFALAVDCKLPTSKIDKIICSNYDLAGEDAKLNEGYAEAMKKLSPEGQSSLRADQSNWLRYRTQACGFSDSDTESGNMRCLIQQFVRRDHTFWSIAHQRTPSPYVLFSRSTFETTPDSSGGMPFWSESSVPQMDHQSLSASISWSDATAWNTLIAKLVGGAEKSSVCPGGKGDIYKIAHITTASVLLIGVTVDRDDQCRVFRPNLLILRSPGPFNGLPQDHFMSETHYNIVMMRGDVHELEPTDLFSQGDDWKRVLTERLEQEVKKQAIGHSEDWHPTADAMRKVATDPSNWTPGIGDFLIRVNQTALGQDEFIGGFTVKISGSDLQGILSFKGKRILNAPNW